MKRILMLCKPTTPNVWIILIIWILLLSSCKTNVFVANSTLERITPDKEFLIIQNPTSNVFPAGVYPDYKHIDAFVITSKPSVQRIDSLIFDEFVKANVPCEIIGEKDLLNIQSGSKKYVLRYQDYWSWDFKPFMHILIISVFDSSNNKLSDYVSQGNTGGMHNFPTPEKQVPELVALILKE